MKGPTFNFGSTRVREVIPAPFCQWKIEDQDFSGQHPGLHLRAVDAGRVRSVQSGRDNSDPTGVLSARKLPRE